MSKNRTSNVLPMQWKSVGESWTRFLICRGFLNCAGNDLTLVWLDLNCPQSNCDHKKQWGSVQMTRRMMTVERPGRQWQRVKSWWQTVSSWDTGRVPTHSLIYTATQMSPFDQVTKCDKNEKLRKCDQSEKQWQLAIKATLKHHCQKWRR